MRYAATDMVFAAMWCPPTRWKKFCCLRRTDRSHRRGCKMRPSKSVQDMELSSLKEKFKDKKFAAGCSRDVIRQGAEMLGWELDPAAGQNPCAMRASEANVAAEMSAF